MAYIYNLADNWVDAGVTYTSFKMNVTDTASNAASLLMDLQVGGVSQFKVSKAGVTTTGGVLTVSGSAIINGNVGVAGFANSYNWGSVLTLVGDASDILAQRRGVNAQTSRIYNTYTDASNYERLAMRFTSNAFYISSERAGTGTQRSVNIGSDSGAGSLIRLNVDGSINFFTSFVGGNPWNINTSGHFIAGVDNTYDIGASGANRPRNVYAAGSIDAGSNVFAAGRIQAPKLRITDGITAPAATAGFAEIYVDAADGDLKIVFGDGTVKTIVTDT